MSTRSLPPIASTIILLNILQMKPQCKSVLWCFWESAFPRLSYFVQCIESIWLIYIAEQTEKKKDHHFFLLTSVSISVLFCQLKPVKFDSKCIKYVLMLWKNYEKKLNSSKHLKKTVKNKVRTFFFLYLWRPDFLCGVCFTCKTK